jgi:tRNA A-37 threonylcarbamoyl transferase component Bud32
MSVSRAPWWMYLLAASVISAHGFTAWTDFVHPQNPGFTRARWLSLQIGTATPDGPFARAGVRPGDVLLAIDGRRFESVLDWDFAAAGLEIDTPFALEVRRGQETVHLTVVLDQRNFWLWDWRSYVAAISLNGARLICLALALLIVFKRPNDLSARLAAWLLGSFAAAGPLLVGQTTLLRHVAAPIRLLVFTGLTLADWPTAWFCFFATFPRRLLTRPWHWLLALGPGSVVFLYSAVLFGRLVYFPNQETGPVPWRAAFVGVGVSVVQGLAGVAILIFNYLRLRDVNEHRKLRVLLLGTAIGWPAGLVTTVFSQIASQYLLLRTVLAVAGPVLFLLFPLAFAYAILRHRLFDIGFIIRQGLQYALARSVVLSMLPAVVVALLADLMLHRNQTVGAILAQRGWPYGAIGILALVALTRRQAWLEAIDRRFFRERYNAQQILREVAEEVRQARSLDAVASRVVGRVEAALHTEFAALLVRDPREPSYRALASAPPGLAPPALEADTKLIGLLRLLGKPLQVSTSDSGWLQQLPHVETDFLRGARIDLLVPVSFSTTSREALLALGQKKSEEPYGSEDQELLLAIANSLAILLERPGTMPSRSGSAECSQCGGCYESGVDRCPLDATTLTHSAIPRVLANRYRLERRLGRGGMGTVYRARDTVLDRQVALKLMREDLVSSPEMAERFRREARAAAAITHPNLVTLYDFTIDSDNRAFLVMELLTGGTLRQRLREQTRLPAAIVIGIVRGVCSALAVAHQRGLVHRDLKPENVVLVEDAGRELPKVLDFGLAKFLGSSEAATHATLATGGGVLLGTTPYMSPEQLQGKPVSHQWDLWALAVMVYEMLCGTHPFGDRRSVAALQAAILAGDVTPLNTHVPQAPVAWQAFFEESLNADALLRPPSAADFLARCERALDSGTAKPG